MDNVGATAPIALTPLRAISPGTGSTIAAGKLENGSAGFPIPDPITGTLGLIGLELNPNTAQGQTFTIIDNTATSIVIDPADGDMTAFAAPGDPYIGVYHFDNLRVLGGASLVTADQCVVLGTLDTTGGSVTCDNLP